MGVIPYSFLEAKMFLILKAETETDSLDAIRITARSYASTAKDEETKNQFIAIADRIEMILSEAWDYAEGVSFTLWKQTINSRA